MKYLPFKSTGQQQKATDICLTEKIIDLPGLIHFLETDYTDAWKELEERQSIEGVRKFGKSLEELGNAHHAEIIANYGNKLTNAANNFDVESILKLIKDYPVILKKIKD